MGGRPHTCRPPFSNIAINRYCNKAATSRKIETMNSPPLFKVGDAVNLLRENVGGIVESRLINDSSIFYLVKYEDSDGTERGKCFAESDLAPSGVPFQ